MSSGAPDYSGMKVDVVLRPEWAAVAGKEKAFALIAGNKAHGESVTGSYTVPSGKTLYIVSYTGISQPYAQPATYDMLYCRAQLSHTDPTVIMVDQGGIGGIGYAFPQPLLVEAGQDFLYGMWTYALIAVTLGLYIMGYEV